MILKLTVYNNDYSELLCRFGRRIATGWHAPGPKPQTPDRRDWLDKWFRDDEHYRQTLRLKKREASPEEQKTICRIVSESFKAFLTEENLGEKTVDYLTGKFDVTVLDSVNETWHNGEVVYVFPTSGTPNPVLSY